jgi:hypothetical protein
MSSSSDDSGRSSPSDHEKAIPHILRKPQITHLNRGRRNDPTYIPVFSGEMNHFLACFTTPQGVAATASELYSLFLPDTLLDKWVESTNAYANDVQKRIRVRTITRAHLLRFFATIIYMGMVGCPSKEDYFQCNEENKFWPTHPAVKISFSLFNYLWKFFHISHQTSYLQEGDEVDEEEDDKEELEEEGEAISIIPEDEEDVGAGKDPATEIWYSKVKGFVDHVNDVSKQLCRNPGSTLAIDEMTKRFKPIKDGYKFFAICDSSTGYVYDFFPDGRLDTTNTAASVQRLIHALPRGDILKYVVTMDKHFTTPQVLREHRRENVAIVGTARKSRGWPPWELKDIQDERFNSLYVYHHSDGYLIYRWIDNSEVLMVSSQHTGEETITRQRHKPRVNTTNRHHLETVWGANPMVPLDIPGVFDDYNHWMGGVDKADQLIAYYRPNLHCRRTWMPIFFHCLDIVRVNALVIAKSRDPKLNHKTFLQTVIESLNKRASEDEQEASRAASAFLSPPPSGKPKKKRRMSHTSPHLPDCRKEGSKEEHIMTMCHPQRACIYCSYESARSKLEGMPGPNIARTARHCSYCKVQLCNAHWDIFHGWN